MKCAVKKPVQLRLCRQKKCPTHLRLRAYLIKCLETTRRPWIRINFNRIAETFGVSDRTLRRAKKRLEQDNDLKFRTLSKARGSGWQVIVALEANLLWDKEPLFYKKQQEQFRSRNVKDRHCGDLIEERIARCSGGAEVASSNLATREWPSLQHVPIQGIRRLPFKLYENTTKPITHLNYWGEKIWDMAHEQGLEPRTYWLTANRSTIELLKNEASCVTDRRSKREQFLDSLKKCRLEPTTNGLKGRCSTVELPGNGNGENVAESSAFVDSLRKSVQREECTSGYEPDELVRNSNGNGENVAESSAFVDSLRKCTERPKPYESSALLHVSNFPRPQPSEQSHRGFESLSNRHLLQWKLAFSDQSQAQCGDFLHRRPSPDPRLTDTVAQLNSEPRQSESESLRQPLKGIEHLPSKQRVVGSNASNGADCKSAGYAQNVRLWHVIGHLKEADSKSASSSRSAQARQTHNLKITSPSAQTTSLTRSQAPVVTSKHHDRRVRVPQVNDSNPQQPESQSGGSPFAGRNRTGDKSLTDTLLYKERVPSGRTAVKTRSQRSRRWILAASGAELRRIATTKQIRLAYFHARSACTWSIWDNCKVKDQPTVAKSLWLAGLLAGYSPKTIDRAFDEALHYGHGMATDVGLNEGNPRMKFEMSIVVSYAKKLLQNQKPE